jgi:single-stranded-DNA-specific exonuclease
MAAGFTIETSKIEEFAEKFERISSPLLTPDVLTKKLKVDVKVEFENLNLELMDAILKFEPSGVGNPTPVFVTFGVNVKDARRVGTEGKHLKLTLEKGDKVFSAIAFGKGGVYSKLLPNKKVDVVFNLSADTWNGNTSLQLKIRDLRVN